MAYIDLKNCDIYFQDGHSNTGAVNNASGYTIGATTMVVDTIVGIIPVLSIFTMAGDTTEYKVTAHTETTGATTSITFTPGLVTAATDNEVITFGARRIAIKVGDGNLSYTSKTPREFKKDRGILDGVRNADQDPMDVTMSMAWEFLHSIPSATTPTPYEVLEFEGPAATWTSTNPDPCSPHCLDILVRRTDPCLANNVETYLFPQYYSEQVSGDLKTGLLSTQGKCNVLKPIITRL